MPEVVHALIEREVEVEAPLAEATKGAGGRSSRATSRGIADATSQGCDSHCGHLDARRVAYQYLDGATSVSERKKRVDAFQSGSGDLFLISLRAGGVGLNLTAADYVLHMDPWWNPAVEEQASARAHRLGQERPVTVYRLVTRHTIEEKTLALHERKRALTESLLQGVDLGGKVKADELLDLLREV